MALDEEKEFVAQYAVELRDLTFNSKPIINTLTMLASENKPTASSISAVVEKHILTCDPKHKLFALYLLDSIVKNVGLPYTSLFARNLPEVYANVWTTLPESRASLQKLFNTWQQIFPAEMLAVISQRTHNRQAAAWPRSLPASPSSQQYAVLMPRSPGQPSTSYADPRAQLGYPYDQQPGYANGQAAYQPMYHPAPQYAPQPSYVPVVRTARQYGGSHAQQSSSNHQPASYNPPVSAAYNPPVSAAYNPPSSKAVPDFLSSLMQAGLIAMPGQQASGVGQGGDSKDPSRVAFVPAKLKELDASVVSELLADSDLNRGKFLDLKMMRRRRQATGSKLSRQWFVNEDSWLAGTTADAQAAPAFFDEDQAEDAKEAEEEVSVPADESQPNCALSGEKFEMLWDEENQQWRYKGAKALDAQEAERFGLAEGTLVKVSCLGPPGAALGAEESIAAAGGAAAAEELAAAAGAESERATTDAQVSSAVAGDATEAVIIKVEQADGGTGLGEKRELAELTAAERSPKRIKVDG